MKLQHKIYDYSILNLFKPLSFNKEVKSIKVSFAFSIMLKENLSDFFLIELNSLNVLNGSKQFANFLYLKIKIQISMFS